MSDYSNWANNFLSANITRFGPSATFRNMLTIPNQIDQAQNPINGPTSVGVAASQGSTSLTIACPYGGWFLRAGDKFSIFGDATVYTVQAQAITTTVKGQTIANVQILPALANAAALGAVITFTWLGEITANVAVKTYESELINGDSVQAGDLRIIVSASSLNFQPTPIDKIIITGKEYSIVTCKPTYTNNVIIKYEIQAR